jgi:hypothetical protein
LAGPCRRDPRVVAKIILMRIGGICGLPPPDPPNPPNRPGSACTTVIVAWAGSMPIRPKPALTKVFGNNWLGGLGGLGGSDMGTLRHDFPRGGRRNFEINPMNENYESRPRHQSQAQRCSARTRALARWSTAWLAMANGSASKAPPSRRPGANSRCRRNARTPRERREIWVVTEDHH